MGSSVSKKKPVVVVAPKPKPVRAQTPTEAPSEAQPKPAVTEASPKPVQVSETAESSQKPDIVLVEKEIKKDYSIYALSNEASVILLPYAVKSRQVESQGRIRDPVDPKSLKMSIFEVSNKSGLKQIPLNAGKQRGGVFVEVLALLERAESEANRIAIQVPASSGEIQVEIITSDREIEFKSNIKVLLLLAPTMDWRKMSETHPNMSRALRSVSSSIPYGIAVGLDKKIKPLNKKTDHWQMALLKPENFNKDEYLNLFVKDGKGAFPDYWSSALATDFGGEQGKQEAVETDFTANFNQVGDNETKIFASRMSGKLNEDGACCYYINGSVDGRTAPAIFKIIFEKPSQNKLNVRFNSKSVHGQSHLVLPETDDSFWPAEVRAHYSSKLGKVIMSEFIVGADGTVDKLIPKVAGVEFVTSWGLPPNVNNPMIRLASAYAAAGSYADMTVDIASNAVNKKASLKVSRDGRKKYKVVMKADGYTMPAITHELTDADFARVTDAEIRMVITAKPPKQNE